MPLKKRSRRGTSTSGSIDVHCHVFNARDVPIRKFVELVYLEKYPGGSLPVSPVKTIDFSPA